MLRLFAAVGLLSILSGCASDPGCTEIGCVSTLELRFDHALDLAAGPYQLEITTPLHQLRCSVGPELTAERTCFGFRFTDLAWDEDTLTLRLTGPFTDGVSNPDGTPWDSVEVVLSQGDAELGRRTVGVDAGDPNQPNGPGCPPTCWTAIGTDVLP